MVKLSHWSFGLWKKAQALHVRYAFLPGLNRTLSLAGVTSRKAQGKDADVSMHPDGFGDRQVKSRQM